MHNNRSNLLRRLGPAGLVVAALIYVVLELLKDAIASAVNRKIGLEFDVTLPFLSSLEYSLIAVFVAAALGIVIVGLVFRLGLRFRGFGEAWWERDELEIYYIANISVGKRPDATPLDREPVVSRLRLLKDAIRNGELPAVFDGDKPNAWATVKLDDFERFADQDRRRQFRSVAKKWRKKNAKAAAPPPEKPWKRAVRVGRLLLSAAKFWRSSEMQDPGPRPSSEEHADRAKRVVEITQAATEALASAAESATDIIKKVNWLKGRMRLAALRTAGVEVRNRKIGRDELATWVEEVESWGSAVIRQLEEMDAADAEQFKTLDVVPKEPRVLPPSSELALYPGYVKHFREHDHRLKVLKDLLDRYALMAA